MDRNRRGPEMSSILECQLVDVVNKESERDFKTGDFFVGPTLYKFIMDNKIDRIEQKKNCILIQRCNLS